MSNMRRYNSIYEILNPLAYISFVVIGVTVCTHCAGMKPVVINHDNEQQSFNGLCVRYNDSDSSITVVKCVRGFQSGFYFVYDLDGNIRVSGKYRKDKKVGNWRYYLQSGHEWKKRKYKNNILVKESILTWSP